ncbi:MAG: exodeoxyribonuclease III [Alphaproteobacteria bacterium GM202ARS2]|nr:exodeoxyribonuclease III [Alphaproteobacteria bacterium GM202ARS2]
MRIATWNVNSLRARLSHLCHWLNKDKVDVVLLQELKAQNHQIDTSALEDLGYNVALFGQKSWNGVAILSRFPLEDIRYGVEGAEALPEEEEVADPYVHARYIEAVVSTSQGIVRVASIYAPNGNPIDSDKFDKKQRFMEQLDAHVAALMQEEEKFVLAGDYNVLLDDRDAPSMVGWEKDALGHPQSVAALRGMIHRGLVDALRVHHTGTGLYSFWDYQGGAWQRDNGLLIDRLLLSPQAADGLRASGVMKQMRGQKQASDHVPVWCQLVLDKDA